MRSSQWILSTVIRRHCSNRQTRCFITDAAADPSPSLRDASQAPPNFDPSSAVVYEAFVSEQEGQSLANDLLDRLKRRRYEKGHWDAVITDYKEIELPAPILSEDSLTLIHRVRNQLAKKHLNVEHHSHGNENDYEWLPPHGIDLKRDGNLKPHVDSVRFSGDLVAGVSLLSSSIMRLKPHDPFSAADHTDAKAADDKWVDLYLPPLSLYVLTGVSRYQYTHELLPCGSIFQGPDGVAFPVTRDRRLSIILRDSKQDD